MCRHEEEKCPRCGGGFECKMGDIVNCQCYGIRLNTEQESYMMAHYSGCLCRNCLLYIQQYIALPEKPLPDGR